MSRRVHPRITTFVVAYCIVPGAKTPASDGRGHGELTQYTLTPTITQHRSPPPVVTSPRWGEELFMKAFLL